MTRKQRETDKLKKKIAILQDQIFEYQLQLRQLENTPDFDEEERLLDFPDFPGNGTNGHIYTVAIYKLAKEKSDNLNSLSDVTVGDLVKLSPQELLDQKGFGVRCLKALEKWMNSYCLRFDEKDDFS